MTVLDLKVLAVVWFHTRGVKHLKFRGSSTAQCRTGGKSAMTTLKLILLFLFSWGVYVVKISTFPQNQANITEDCNNLNIKLIWMKASLAKCNEMSQKLLLLDHACFYMPHPDRMTLRLVCWHGSINDPSVKVKVFCCPLMLRNVLKEVLFVTHRHHHVVTIIPAKACMRKSCDVSDQEVP